MQNISDPQMLPKYTTPTAILLLSGLNFLLAILAVIGILIMRVQFAPYLSSSLNQQPDDIELYFLNNPILALILGLLVGLPENIWRKWRFRHRREDAIQQLMRSSNRQFTWAKGKTGLTDTLPSMASHAIAIILMFFLHLSVWPAWFSPGISSVLWYSEYRDVYAEAQRRLSSKA